MLCKSLKILIILTTFEFTEVRSSNLFNDSLYESVLDPILCQRHLQKMNAIEFYDASFRFTQSITLGSQGSAGNFHQCLGIRQEFANDVIEGKYCTIEIPYQENITLPSDLFDPSRKYTWQNISGLRNRSQDKIYVSMRQTWAILLGMANPDHRTSSKSMSDYIISLAVCIPKACTTRDVVGKQLDRLNITYYDGFCRLSNDKMFSAIDWIAVSLLTIIGILLICSTSYDLIFTFILRRDIDEQNKLLLSFSLYTNTNDLFNFKRPLEHLNCLDGLRSISILWIACGHSFTNTFFTIIMNPFNMLEWATTSLGALWLLSANLAVDTFFIMTGVLLVYTKYSQLTRKTLMNKLHFFVLHRLLRIFPLLAVAVLFQASIIHHVADGPKWNTMEPSIQACRDWWWSTLLHIQNYVNVSELCLPHSWYLSVDTQLYIISPIILYWMLVSHRGAWLSLTGGLLTSLTVATIYCFCYNFTISSFLGLPVQTSEYFKKYYVNTLTRSPVFFMGMIFGYLLHIIRNRIIEIPMWFIPVGWTWAFVLGSSMVYVNNPALDLNTFWSNSLNVFMRPLWALSMGWLIFACARGYGGPVNWFLSLSIWKFISRISFSLYLFHYPLQIILRTSSEAPTYFSVMNLLSRLFFSDLVVSLIFSTVMCIVIDAPISNLFKIALDRATRPRVRPRERREIYDSEEFINPITA